MQSHDETAVDTVCLVARGQFSAYLDGVLDGRSMALLGQHLHECRDCEQEFEAWRSVQRALGNLGPAAIPSTLQDQLRDTLAGEIGTGRHLAPRRRLRNFLHTSFVPAFYRLGAGLVAAVVLLVCAAWIIGTALPVQANDDRLAHLNAPKYLYSTENPVPITARENFAAVMVDAMVDSHGRVYDYRIVYGPQDAVVRREIERNLLAGVFRPANVFGEPVPGHIMLTYTTVSIRG